MKKLWNWLQVKLSPLYPAYTSDEAYKLLRAARAARHQVADDPTEDDGGDIPLDPGFLDDEETE